MRTFVIGDIHGNLRALKECLNLVEFDFDNDTLITIGDIVDGFPESFECVELLLRCKNRIDIMGNHDRTILDFLQTGEHAFDWIDNNIDTAKSYARVMGTTMTVEHEWDYHRVGLRPLKKRKISFGEHVVREDIFNFFKNQKLWYIDDKNRAFVHAGWIDDRGLGHDDDCVYYLTSQIWDNIYLYNKGKQHTQMYSDVFVGHTRTTLLNVNNTTEPIIENNVHNIDTGAGYDGKLTIMNVDTKEYWQSNLVRKYEI